MKIIPLTIVLSLFFIQIDSHSAFGDKSSYIERELNREKKELGRIKSKLGAEAKKVEKEKKREKSVLEKLSVINKKLRTYQKEATQYNNNLERANKKLTKIKNKLNKNQEKIRVQKNILQKRLRVLYKEGEATYLKVLFTAADPNDFLQRLKYMKLIANLDAELISQYRANTISLEDSKSEAEQVAKKVLFYKESTQKKKNEILGEKRKKQHFLYKIRNRRNTYEKAQKELFEASKELSDLIEILEKSYLDDKNLTFNERKGFLPWPVRGKVVAPFGKIKNEKFQTYTFNNGVEIAASVGKNVRAVYTGKVLFSGELRGYGLMVILGHGKGYYSLYAHLNKSLVKKNDRVLKAQVFAYTGDSGSLHGPSLYFEIRNKRVPENPLEWLSVAKK